MSSSSLKPLDPRSSAPSWQSFFSYSISANEDDARLAHMLKVISYGSLVFGVVYTATLLLFSIEPPLRILAHGAYLVSAGLVLRLCVTRRILHLASLFYCISFFLFFFIDAWSDKGISDISYLGGSLLVICVSSILLGLRAGFASAILVTLAGLLLATAEYRGWIIPKPAPPPFECWLNAIFFFGGFLVFIYLADRALRQSLGHARHELEERTRAETALRDREEQFRFALEAARIATWEWNVQTNAVRWSHGAGSIFGLSDSDSHPGTSHKEYLSLIHPQDRAYVEVAIAKALENGSDDYVVEHRVTSSSENKRWVEVKGRVIRDLNGAPLLMRGVMTDVTARKNSEEERLELEDRMRQAQRMEALGKLAGGVAHDFNNILTGILGHADIARLEFGNHPAQTNLQEISNAALRAGALTQQLVALSRKQMLKLRVLDVNAVVADIQKLLERLIGSHISLHSELTPEPFKIKADKGQLEQVILNLVVNARDAMPQGGKIVIGTKNIQRADARPLWGTLDDTHEILMLSVSDSGIGMGENVKAHLFEPYFTTKTEGRGAGLGLSTVYGIVQQSSGAIGLESESGKGTTFYIYLPATKEKPTGAQASPLKPHTESKGEVILVAEDNKTIAEVLRSGLGAFGFKVLVGEDGESATQLAKAESGHLHLLLTDVIMPGKSGIVLAAEVRSIHPEAKVLYMSGYTADKLPQDTAESNMQFIEKPFTLEKLAAKIREVLDA